jgi:hypothetical protein
MPHRTSFGGKYYKIPSKGELVYEQEGVFTGVLCQPPFCRKMWTLWMGVVAFETTEDKE